MKKTEHQSAVPHHPETCGVCLGLGCGECISKPECPVCDGTMECYTIGGITKIPCTFCWGGTQHGTTDYSEEERMVLELEADLAAMKANMELMGQGMLGALFDAGRAIGEAEAERDLYADDLLKMVLKTGMAAA